MSTLIKFNSSAQSEAGSKPEHFCIWWAAVKHVVSTEHRKLVASTVGCNGCSKLPGFGWCHSRVESWLSIYWCHHPVWCFNWILFCKFHCCLGDSWHITVKIHCCCYNLGYLLPLSLPSASRLLSLASVVVSGFDAVAGWLLSTYSNFGPSVYLHLKIVAVGPA